MAVRLGRPRGVMAWTLAIGSVVALIMTGGRSHRPLYGLLDRDLFGLAPGIWLAIA
jgi:hypothetical protein